MSYEGASRRSHLRVHKTSSIFDRKALVRCLISVPSLCRLLVQENRQACAPVLAKQERWSTNEYHLGWDQLQTDPTVACRTGRLRTEGVGRRLALL